MAVRTRLSWRWRVLAVLCVGAGIAGMWLTFGGFDRWQAQSQVDSLEYELAQLQRELSELRSKSSQLETELAMAKGSQAALSRQTSELQSENSQLKDEVSFLRNVVTDSTKQAGVSIQRLAATRGTGDEVHFSMLVVRGTGSSADFQGKLKLQATLLQAAIDGEAPIKPTMLTLPDDEPATAGALDLRFKYYQRVEGSFRVPSGATLRSLTARAFEAGQTTPQATQNVNFQ